MTSVHLSPGNLRTLMKKFSFLLKEHFLLWNIMWNIPILPWAFLTFASKSWRPLLEGQYIIIHSWLLTPRTNKIRRTWNNSNMFYKCWTLTVLKIQIQIQIEENMKQSNLKKAPPLREGPNYFLIWSLYAWNNFLTPCLWMMGGVREATIQI